ncbi:hypothetical protein SRABI44_02868 [Microbacterium foliorum]|nr:hypothetical protein SRABI03_02520 [Microbacterium foliorum]CAH0239453.1 hypothetical protein SRABI44_02868 [Microbacterium foliorum]
MMPVLFPGPLAPMPDRTTIATMIWPNAAPTPPPRFVEGFEPFVAYARDAGADPAALAADPLALWDFVAAHAGLLEAPATAEAAARFLGNTIAVVHPAATWRMTSEPEVGTSVMSVPVTGLLRTMVEHPEHREPFRQMLASWPQADLDDQEDAALANEAVEVDLVTPPVPFVRPEIALPGFLDDDGRIIPYGSRWGGGPPPEDAYSRVSHLERFAPVATVVDALVAYLETWYAVAVDRRTDGSGSRIVHLRPTTGAPTTIASGATGEPLTIEAGVLFRDTVPGCTCDACDETAGSVADQLEETVLAIAAGGLREVFPVGRRRWLHTRIHTPDGTGRSSSGEPGPSLAAELLGAEEVLRGLPDGWWPAWTLRPHPA